MPNNVLASLASHGDLLWNLVVRDLKIRYRGSILGFLWTILTPLLMAVIYVFFLRLLAGRGVVIQHAEIIIGVFAWQFTVQCVNAGLSCVTGNTCLVKKVLFPRIILPLSVCVANLVNFLLTLVVQWAIIVALWAWWGGPPLVVGGALLCLPFSLYHLAVNLALALLVAAANVWFRDTQHLVNLVLSAWFFMSPVMYPMSLVEAMGRHYPWVAQAFVLNPMTVIITGYRALQLPDVAFPWSAMAWVGWLWPLVLLVAAWLIFERAQRYFSDVL